MDKRQIPAGQFKDRCLALMDEVATGGPELVITKHGRPVVRVIPAEVDSASPAKSIFGCLAGSVTYNEVDLTASVDEVWNADKD
jgi:prevent-host-death family protein